MITDLDCAKLCQSLYDGERIFNYQGVIDEVSLAFKDYPDCSVIIFEGSHNFDDWANDFEAVMIRPQRMKGAGVHKGFHDGLDSCLSVLEGMLSKTKPIYITGHSLGAGRAHIFAATLLLEGYNVIVVAFGSPRPGDDKLAGILENIPVRSYWNYRDDWDHDLVGDVPICITPLFRFVSPTDRIIINVPPKENDPWGYIMGWHHLNYYIDGIVARG